MEIWDIYTKERLKTNRTIKRGEKLAPDEFHLVVHIWIQNSKGEYLIQKRAAHLSWMPNTWATTGGAVIAGEESLIGAVRETQEELGIDIKAHDLKFVFTQIRGQDISDIYLAHLDLSLSEYKFDTNDMSALQFVSKEEIQKMISEKTFVDYGKEYFSLLRF